MEPDKTLEMEPLVGGERLTTLLELVTWFDAAYGVEWLDADAYDLNDADEARSRPLRQALLRVEAEMVNRAADRIAGSQRREHISHDDFQSAAADELIDQIAASMAHWYATAWFPAPPDPAHRRVMALTRGFVEVLARVEREHDELDRRFDEMFPGNPLSGGTTPSPSSTVRRRLIELVGGAGRVLGRA